MIIGISGKARSGKDTVAILLQAALRNKGYNFLRKSLAEPLKVMYAKSAEITLAQLEADKETHRPGLQELGDTARRNNPDFWINKLIMGVGAKQNIIIPDIRYQNEYDFVRRSGGFIIRVERDRHLREQHGKLINEFHVSEVNLDSVKAVGWDKIFYNNGNKDELNQRVVEYVDKIAPRMCEFILGTP